LTQDALTPTPVRAAGPVRWFNGKRSMTPPIRDRSQWTIATGWLVGGVHWSTGSQNPGIDQARRDSQPTKTTSRPDDPDEGGRAEVAPVERSLRWQSGLSGTMVGMRHLRSVDQLADWSVVRWVVDVALVVAAVAASLPSLFRDNAHPPALAVPVLVAVAAPLIVRRFFPLPVFGWI